MIRKNAGPVTWLEFELLQPYPLIRHGTCTRRILPPQMPTGEHHPAFAACTHLAMNQVHGSCVVRIDSPSASQPTADSSVTNVPNLALIVKHADCQPCLLFDPEHAAIGAVHSGWKGSCLNIYRSTVEFMQSQFGTKPGNLIACIGPSLGPCHAEFIHWRNEFPVSFEPFCLPDSRFDFWAISQHQLETCGVKPEHIEIAKICTRCHPESFCSYRFDPAIQERNVSFIAMQTATQPLGIGKRSP